MLQGMIKQRRESITLYEQGNRPDLAQQENEEIAVIESFLPQQMSEGEITAAAQSVNRRDRRRGYSRHGQGYGHNARAACRRNGFQPRRPDRQTASRRIVRHDL